MKLSSITNRWIIRLMLVSGLFAQIAVAAHACEQMHGQGFAAKAAEIAEMHCHSHHSSGASNANVCLEHCSMGNQISIDQVVPDFVTPNTISLAVAAPVNASDLPTYVNSSLILDTGPPVSIRFCSFQI
jgi:hypothetical protein